MKRFHRPFFALLLSLLLLGSQQAAFAHLLCHIGSGEITATQYKGDHGSFDGVAETCLSCIAVAAQAASAPPPSHLLCIAAFVSGEAIAVPLVCLPGRPFAGAQARAPPSLL